MGIAVDLVVSRQPRGARWRPEGPQAGAGTGGRAQRAPPPPRQGPEVDPSRNQAMSVPRGGGPPPRGCRSATGSGAAPPGAARAARTPARTFPWIEDASFFPPRGLAGLPPRLRPLGSRRPHAGPIGGDDHIDGQTPRASRASRARRAGPSPGLLRAKRKPGGFPPGFVFVVERWLRLCLPALQEQREAREGESRRRGLGNGRPAAAGAQGRALRIHRE